MAGQPDGDGDVSDPACGLALEGLGGGKLAATVLLIRDGRTGLEVWVQERVSTMPNYPGITVFPGGGVDRRDFPTSFDGNLPWSGPSIVATARALGTSREKAFALVSAAVRELFEETGTLLALDSAGDAVSDATCYHPSRLALESHRLSLSDVLSENNLKISSNLLRPWARWVGTSESGQLFDTFSFLAVRPSGQEPDGNNTETESAGWFPPGLLLDGWRAGLIRLVVPTWAQLVRLARCRSVREAMAEAELSVMSPILGDDTRDPRFQEFFNLDRPERI